ncbi:hypothetical protein [Weissella sp. LMG 11983]|uniref:hypothetical protein n=1 Tax=Weissella sp. LMG 11983 TaxID=2987700 RepID=UPI0021F82B59|nr:hypothetical protein [Weissella sp. LMG 11983]MCW0925902.1 hypothetical protein [Weissella sp. LMG 11983]
MAKVIDALSIRDMTLVALDEDLPMDTKIGNSVRLNGKIVHIYDIPAYDLAPVHNVLILGVKVEVGDEIMFEK